MSLKQKNNRLNWFKKVVASTGDYPIPQMKLLACLIFILVFSGCSKKLQPGEYRYKNQSRILIDSSFNYRFQSFNHIVGAFSFGKVSIQGTRLMFAPDSLNIFSIKHKEFLKGNNSQNAVIKLQKDSSNKINLSYFNFYLENSNHLIFRFGTDATLSLISSLLTDTNFLIAKLNLDSGVIVPKPINDSLIVILPQYSTYALDTLNLVVNISTTMFDFIVLKDFYLQNTRIKSQSGVIYNLVRKH